MLKKKFGADPCHFREKHTKKCCHRAKG